MTQVIADVILVTVGVMCLMGFVVIAIVDFLDTNEYPIDEA